MSPSRFHGIFRSLQQESAGKGASPKDETKGSVSPPTARGDDNAQGQTGKIAVDVYEADDYYIVKAPIAGVRMSDIDIEVTDNVLTIRGVRRQTDDLPSDQYYVQECFWGPFKRSVTFPGAIDPKKVKATFNRDCVLKVLIPKEERVKIVRIQEA